MVKMPENSDWDRADVEIVVRWLVEGCPWAIFPSVVAMEQALSYARQKGNAVAVSVIQDMLRLKATSLCGLIVAASKSNFVSHATLPVLDRFLLGGPSVGMSKFNLRVLQASERNPVIAFFHRGWTSDEAFAWHELRYHVRNTSLGLVSIDIEDSDNATLQSIFSDDSQLPGALVFVGGEIMIGARLARLQPGEMTVPRLVAEATKLGEEQVASIETVSCPSIPAGSTEPALTIAQRTSGA